MWRADHTRLDVRVLDEQGRAVRPWLSVLLQDHLRAVAGHPVFLGSPSAVLRALALRQWFSRRGRPRFSGQLRAAAQQILVGDTFVERLTQPSSTPKAVAFVVGKMP